MEETEEITLAANCSKADADALERRIPFEISKGNRISASREVFSLDRKNPPLFTAMQAMNWNILFLKRHWQNPGNADS